MSISCGSYIGIILYLYNRYNINISKKKNIKLYLSTVDYSICINQKKKIQGFILVHLFLIS